MSDNSFIPTCHHCGQAMFGEKNFKSQGDADAYALNYCDCGGAKDYQAEQKRIAERQKNIDNAKETIYRFRDYCENKAQPLTDEIKVILLSCAVLAIDGKIDAANIQFGRIKSKLTINAKGAVTLCFSYADSVKMEA